MNGVNCIERIQEIINLYVRLYEAIGAKIQEEKAMFYCWRYRMINGERIIEQIEAVIIIHDTEIVQIDINESTRTLGIYVTPTLS